MSDSHNIASWTDQQVSASISPPSSRSSLLPQSQRVGACCQVCGSILAKCLVRLSGDCIPMDLLVWSETSLLSVSIQWKHVSRSAVTVWLEKMEHVFLRWEQPALKVGVWLQDRLTNAMCQKIPICRWQHRWKLVAESGWWRGRLSSRRVGDGLATNSFQCQWCWSNQQTHLERKPSTKWWRIYFQNYTNHNIFRIILKS